MKNNIKDYRINIKYKPLSYNKIFKHITNDYKPYESLIFGMLLAIVGGFLDAYTYVSRGGIFANAQTGNIVLFGIYMAEGQFMLALLKAPPIIAYIVGLFLVETIKSTTPKILKLDWIRLSLILEIIVLIGVGFIPSTVSDIVVTVIISFVASLQVTAFNKLVDAPFSTTTMTGNLRKATHSAYLAKKDKNIKELKKVIRYILVILSFIVGAVLGSITTEKLGVISIWVAVGFLVIALFISIIDKKHNINKIEK